MEAMGWRVLGGLHRFQRLSESGLRLQVFTGDGEVGWQEWQEWQEY